MQSSKCLVTSSLLVAGLLTLSAAPQQNASKVLDLYVRRGLESGLTRGQIAEALTHLGFYAGWAKATKAMTAVTRALGT